MRISAASVFGLASIVVACSRGDRPAADTVSTAKPALLPGMYSLADFSRLRWIEGRWRGTTPDGKNPFFEEYRFRDDSTITKYGFPDSTFAKAADSSQIKLRGGLVRDESPTSSYQATRLDSAGVDFAPDRGATNFFTWTPTSPTSWSATLRWTDRQGRPQTVEYVLQKIAR